MLIVNGRLTCCTCGADLGDAEDPYRDPSCGACYERDMREECEAEEPEDAPAPIPESLSSEAGEVRS